MERTLSSYDDSALIAECLKRINKGAFRLGHEVFVGGIRHDPGYYTLERTSVAITESDCIF